MENTNFNTSKKSLIAVLGKLAPEVKDASLKDMCKYTLEACKKDSAKAVTREDLLELIKEIQLEVQSSAKPVVENSLKPKKPVPTVDETVESILDMIKDSPTKKVVEEKKSEPKKVEEKKPEVKKVVKPRPPEMPEYINDAAKYFPAKLTISEVEFEKRMDLLTLADVIKEMDEGKEVVLATLWTPKMIVQFEYDLVNCVESHINEFPDNLDLLIPKHITENVWYSVSLYSEACVRVLPQGMQIFDGARITKGVDFNIYVSTVTPEETEEVEEEIEEEEVIPEPIKEVKKTVKKTIKKKK